MELIASEIPCLLEHLFQTGWGQTSTYSGTSDELQKVALNITSNQECFEILEDEIRADKIFDSQICAGGVKNKVR